MARFLILVTLLTLSACTGVASYIDVNFDANECWQAVLELRVDSSDPFLEDTITQVESELEAYVTNARNLGVSASWERLPQTDYIQYIVQVGGTGFDVLSEIVFQNEAEIVTVEREGKPYVYFRHYVSPDPDSGNITTIVLHGKKILEGNGQFANTQTMAWENYYGWAEALLEEHSVLRNSTGKLVIDFYSGGSWKTTLDIVVDGENSDLTGPEPQIENYLNTEVVAAQLLGAHASWRSTSPFRPTYQLQMQGAGLNLLNTSLLKDWATVDTLSGDGMPWGPRDISFYEINPGELDFRSLEVTVRGRQIISGNGQSDSATAMTWIDPDEPMYASLTEKPLTKWDTVLAVVREQVNARGNWLPVLIIFPIAALVAIAIITATRKKRRAALAMHQCPHCEFGLPADADFCPQCGAPIEQRKKDGHST